MDIITKGAATDRAPSEWITGSAEFASVASPSPDAPADLTIVRFAPGARTVWHRHPYGQLLIILSGEGQVQAENEDVRAVGPGDMVRIPPGERHWHGASDEAAMTHLAIEIWCGPPLDSHPEEPVSNAS